jgi:hypothetical protein
MKEKPFHPTLGKQLLAEGFQMLSVKGFIVVWHKMMARDKKLSRNAYELRRLPRP